MENNSSLSSKRCKVHKITVLIRKNLDNKQSIASKATRENTSTNELPQQHLANRQKIYNNYHHNFQKPNTPQVSRKHYNKSINERASRPGLPISTGSHQKHEYTDHHTLTKPAQACAQTPVSASPYLQKTAKQFYRVSMVSESATSYSELSTIKASHCSISISKKKNLAIAGSYKRTESAVKYNRLHLRQAEKSASTSSGGNNLLEHPSTFLSARSWILHDIKNNKTLGSHVDVEREIASLTKVMTCLVILEMLVKYQIPQDVKIKVTKLSANMAGTTAKLQQGTWVTVADLLHGLMLPSGNDAATLLSEAFGLLIHYFRLREQQQLCDQNSPSDIEEIDLSSYDSTDHLVRLFLKKMNRKATELGLNSTRFQNVTGLSYPPNFSCARDMLALGLYCIKNRQLMDIVGKQSYMARLWRKQEKGDQYLDNSQVQWRNTNQLVQKGWVGLRTGHTKTAGSCLMSLKDQVLIVLLGCPFIQQRFDDTQKLFQWYKN